MLNPTLPRPHGAGVAATERRTQYRLQHWTVQFCSSVALGTTIHSQAADVGAHSSTKCSYAATLYELLSCQRPSLTHIITTPNITNDECNPGIFTKSYAAGPSIHDDGSSSKLPSIPNLSDGPIEILRVQRNERH
jgi:hypothetical protein